MGKNRPARKSKRINKSIFNLVSLIVLLCLAIGFGISFNRSQELDCPNQIELASYPPDLSFTAPQSELAEWQLGFTGPDRVEHLYWMNNHLMDSSGAIARELGTYLADNTDKFGINFAAFGEEHVAGSVEPFGDRLMLNLDTAKFDSPNRWASVDLSMGLVHEAMHIREYVFRAEKLMNEHGISRAEAYTEIVSSLNEEEVLCGEMQALAIETAYYAELNHIGHVDQFSYHDDYLAQLQKVDWNWRDPRWVSYMRQQLGY